MHDMHSLSWLLSKLPKVQSQKKLCFVATHTWKGLGKIDKSPLPIHLRKSRPTIDSFDNFDHDARWQVESSISGTKSNHDSVVVVFQRCSPEDQISRKPNISECENLMPCTDLTEKQPCQKLEIYARSPDIKKLPLPPSLPTGLPDPDNEHNRKFEIFQQLELLHFLIRFKEQTWCQNLTWKTCQPGLVQVL